MNIFTHPYYYNPPQSIYRLDLHLLVLLPSGLFVFFRWKDIDPRWSKMKEGIISEVNGNYWISLNE